MSRIGYLNANSLPDGKFAQAISLLETSFDFLFIAEHWYQHHELRLSHPLIYCSTHRSPSVSSTSIKGRNHGGIYLLATPSARALIQSTTSSEHSILVTLPSLKFAGVYYPPYSLSEPLLEADLSNLGSVDILIGDINTRFACNLSTTGRGSTVPHSTRSLLFQSWAATHGMVHLSDSQCHKTVDRIPDHAFSKISLQSAITLSLLPTRTLPIHTDHRYLLQLHLKIPFHYPLSEYLSPVQSAIPLRFRMQRLRQPTIAAKYRKAWSIIDQLYGSYNGAEEFDIDMLDSLLCSSIQAIGDTELGTYEPNQARKQPDKTSRQLRQQFDMPASVQLLKRAQHAATAMMPLTSASPSATPLQECINHYQNIFNLHSQVMDIPTTSTNSSCYTSPLSSRNPTSNQYPDNLTGSRFDEHSLLSSWLGDMISPERIKLKIGQMSSSSSGGSDCITLIMLRHLLDTSFPQYLSRLYHSCLRTGKTPARWNQALLYPICKDRTQPFTASNSRPITLSCIFRKIFESLILPVITSSGNMSYSPIQAGFRSGYSTLTNVLTLNHLIEHSSTSDIAFLHFQSAFDRVQWSHLELELKKQGMHPLVLELVYQLMYHDMSYALVVNGTQSRFQSLTRGLPQGSPLAPILFNRFINSLLQDLNQNTKSDTPAALFFADDGVIIAPNARQAQHLLNIATSWADTHSMRFNIRKCGLLVSRRQAVNGMISPLFLHNLPIPQVQSYKYLGVIISRTGVNYSAQAEMLSSRVQKQINAMMWVSDTWCPRIWYNIFKVILSPTLEYSLPLIYAEHLGNRQSPCLKILMAGYYDSVKWIAGGNDNRPHITCKLLGLLPFKDRAIQLTSRFYHHWTKTNTDNPLRCILESLNWYPKSNARVRIPSGGPLLSQFLNSPKFYERLLSPGVNIFRPTLHDHVIYQDSVGKRDLIVNIRSKAPKLIRITLLGERLPGLDADVVLSAPANYQAQFFAWRRGVFGSGRKCGCGKGFDRGHTECMPYSHPLLTDDKQQLFNLDLYLLDPDIKYTLIDFLLNQSLWEQAKTLLDFWILSMSNQLRQTPTATVLS